MTAAPVQCDVDVIPKGSHYISVSTIKVRLRSFLINGHGRPVVPDGHGPDRPAWTIIEPLFEEKRRPDGRDRPWRDARAEARSSSRRWKQGSSSVRVPPRRMVISRGSRSFGRIGTLPFLPSTRNLSREVETGKGSHRVGSDEVWARVRSTQCPAHQRDRTRAAE